MNSYRTDDADTLPQCDLTNAKHQRTAAMMCGKVLKILIFIVALLGHPQNYIRTVASQSDIGLIATCLKTPDTSF